MTSCTAAEDNDRDRIHHSAGGCLITNRMEGTSCPVAREATKDSMVENIVVKSTCK